MSASISIEKIADWAGRNHLVVGALGTLMSLAALGLCAMTLWAARSEVVEHAHETSHNVAAVLVSEIARTVETSNNALTSLAADLGRPAVRHMDARLRHDLLFQHAAAPYVTGMGVTDRFGQLIDGCCSPSHHWNFSDRDYFKVHRDAANVGLYVSEAYRSRARGGTKSIALSRRIERPDHAFNGIAVVAIDLDYFDQLLSRLNVGPHGITAILRADGTILARNPPLSDHQMIRLGRSIVFDRMLNQDAGFYASRSRIDGILRLYTFQRVPGTPLIAVVAPAEHDVLACFVRMSWWVGVPATIICALFCAVVWLLAFALRDNLRKQTRLTDLTRTDPLTGLSNRRALDVALADEWERLQRGNDASLSVLFIDADHFKQYNDRYGHAQGDAALRFLAECIRAHTRRRGDVAARYGGEEFVAVLPDTDESGAAKVAEAIRREVECNRLAGVAEAVPAFTVSIGCATASHAHPPSIDALSRQADLALYTAKRQGRNRVCHAPAQPHAHAA
ncbi:GGDEF domain-containing protein [Burkholderia stagnalis]|uniref:GGDEF domain-containing protein n=1 Tax=Burkholderia stagnalis TaxID=1503054 RepID=UPI000F563043|nr:GGDEF domain-containing protein [Burkholderia stagnalis]RQQ22257.1 GGDEF domain-containing protein [Burkholderia stagnalis]RQQ24200.1 GGDEF domain-containing protein [Burkholderia stagnalis]RQQ42635.1 GGDEF domain-containing protein [Burkholderia stagnalis]RQX89199.1 GGDEF domain-containing protein [Burkholderia stagnalis]RQY05929.1 GGDEF domain-containing protein [Burkholderia stagnalis]